MATNEFDITALLTAKSFEELTELEQSFAVAELGSESAYREMYEIVQGTADFEAPKMTATSRDKTFVAFDELHAEEPTKKRGIIWLRPVVIGLAAASIIAFVWLIGFSDLNKNQTLAENKNQFKKEVKDSTRSKNLEKAAEVEETEESKTGPNTATASVEEVMEQDDLSNKSIPSAPQQEINIAEKATESAPVLADDADFMDEETSAISEIVVEDEELAEEEGIYVTSYKDTKISVDEAQRTQPVRMESASMSRSAKKNSDASGINMNSNISKQSVFKVKLPLRNHYTAY